jgi:hypothetical protein
LQQVAIDIRSDLLVTTMTEKARVGQQPSDGQEIRGLQNELRDTDIRIKKLTNLVEETSTPGPLLTATGRVGGYSCRYPCSAWSSL